MCGQQLEHIFSLVYIRVTYLLSWGRKGGMAQTTYSLQGFYIFWGRQAGRAVLYHTRTQGRSWLSLFLQLLLSFLLLLLGLSVTCLCGYT